MHYQLGTNSPAPPLAQAACLRCVTLQNGEKPLTGLFLGRGTPWQPISTGRH